MQQAGFPAKFEVGFLCNSLIDQVATISSKKEKIKDQVAILRDKKDLDF